MGSESQSFVITDVMQDRHAEPRFLANFPDDRFFRTFPNFGIASRQFPTAHISAN